MKPMWSTQRAIPCSTSTTTWPSSEKAARCPTWWCRRSRKAGPAWTKTTILSMRQPGVRYANVERQYGVTYWEIGNENWHGGGRIEEYLPRAVRIAKAMKAVDPTIKVGCSGENNWQFERILADSEFDFLSLSNYVGSASPGWSGGGWQGGFEHYRTLPPGALTRRVAEAVDAVQSSEAAGRTAEIVVSEFNAVDFEGVWPSKNDLGHALVMFDMLGESLRLPYVSSVMLWTTRWMNAAYPVEMWYALDAENRPTAIGRALAIWGEFFKQHIIAVDVPNHGISAHAAHDPASGGLTLFVINKTARAIHIPVQVDAVQDSPRPKFIFFQAGTN